MDRQFMKWWLIILIISFIKAEDINKNEEQLNPRKNNRIVKLYSGHRPEPINCTNEGFIADPNDCAVFYRCMKSGNKKFTVFKFQCGPGTIYDPESEVCNHPYNTKRAECGSPSKPLGQTNNNASDEEVKELPSPITTKQPVYTERPSTSYFTSTVSTTSNWLSQNINSGYEKPLPIKEQGTTTSGTLVASVVTISQDPTTSTNYLIGSNEIQYLPIGNSMETTTKRIWSRPTIPNSDIDRPNPQKDICVSDGFTGDIDNCHKFYRCVGNQKGGFTRYEFSCSESTIWDEELQSCNHPWAVKRSRCGRSNLNLADNLIPNDKISTNSPEILNENELLEENVILNVNVTTKNHLQIYNVSEFTQSPIETNKVALKRNQTQTNYYQTTNKVGLSTTHETKTIQNSVVHKMTTESTMNNSVQYSQSQILPVNEQHVVAEKNVFSTPKFISDSKNGCQESGFMRDEHDCKKFYRCVDNGKGSYTRYEYFCGEGTVWDSKIEGCNHAWAVTDCNSTSMLKPTKNDSVSFSTTFSTITISSTFSPHSTITNPPNLDVKEPDKDTGYGIIPAQSSTVPSSTSFVQTTKTEFSNKVKCTSDGFIGDENDCKIFYRCIKTSNGKYTKLEYKCGDGTVWDPEIETCNHQWAVSKCGGGSSEFNTTESTVKTTTSTISTTFYPSPIITLTTESKERDNAIDYDSGYDISSYKPFYSSTIKSTKEPTEHKNDINKNDCQHSGFISDKNDCKKFYRCVDNGNGLYTRYEFTCGQGTLWDSKIEACNHAWSVQSCGKEETTTTYSVTNSDLLTSSPSDLTSLNPPSSSNIDKIPDSTTISSLTSMNQDTALNFILNDCKSNGFIGDSRNCKKFYRCVDNGDGSFIKYEFQCGEGMVWDPKIEACNHERAIESCGDILQVQNSALSSSSKPIINDEQVVSDNYSIKDELLVSDTTQTALITDSTSLDFNTNNSCVKSGFLGDKQDCKKFYRCVEDSKGNYIKYEFICGEGSLWDQEIEACNHAWAVKQCAGINAGETDVVGSSTQNAVFTTTSKVRENTNSYTTDKHPTSNVDMGHQTSIYSTADLTGLTASKIPEVTLTTTCLTEGFYADSSNCKKFYRCVNDGKSGYIKYEFMCGDGTFWNDEIQACDHEYNNHKCFQNSLIDSTDKSTSLAVVTASSGITSVSQVEYTTSVTVISPELDGFKCESDGFFANPHDCSKFIRCVANGKNSFTKYEYTCGEGTIWVQEIQACDHDDKSESCKNQISNSTEIIEAADPVVSTEKTQFTSSSSMNTEAQVTLHQDNKHHTEKETIYPTDDVCTEEGFHGSKNNCEKFYRCVNNGRNGFIKYEFTCGEGTAWDDRIKACNHAAVVSSCENIDQNPNEAVPIYHDDLNQQTTTPKISTTTEIPKTPESTEATIINNGDNCQREGYFGDTQDCAKFYRCVNVGKEGFTKYEYKCGNGTIWDQDITNCNNPNDVSNPTCERNQDSNNNSYDSTSTTGPDSDTNVTESSQSSSNCTQQESSLKPQNNNVICKEAGYYPDPNDCKNFYRCVDWNGDGSKFSVYHFTCADGTIWDPVVDTCNHEDSVYPPRNCNGTVTQTDSQGSSSTESISTQETTNILDSSTHTTTESMITTEHTITDSTATTKTSTTIDETTSTTTGKQNTTTKPSASEHTTQKSTTYISTTQPTTIQQTTEHPTTDEQTTTQSMSSSEQTTQESSSSEQTTTQKISTSEQTTQESSSSEQTTTQKISTTEEMTTQETSTTEQETTQKTTTNEQTTQDSSITEQTTTTQSSSTEQTTTEQTTSESSMETTIVPQTTSAQTISTTDGPLTTEQLTDSTTTIDEVHSTTEESTQVNQECPETEENQYLFVCPTSFRRHNKYCNMFYQCTEDDDSHEVKIAMFTCPNNTIYDETKIQCVEQNKTNKKCNGQMAKIRRVKRLGKVIREPIMVGEYSQSCPTDGYYPFEKNAECSPAFLRCSRTKNGNIEGYVHQCPGGYVYWSISKRCEPIQSVRDCKRSRNDWTNRWEFPIDSSNIAR